MQPTTAGSPLVQGSQAPNLSVPPVTTTTPSGATYPNLTIPRPGGALGPSPAVTSCVPLGRLATAASRNAERDNKAVRKTLCDALTDAGGEIPVSLGFLIAPHSRLISLRPSM